MRVTKAKKAPEKIKFKTLADDRGNLLLQEWWKADSERDLATQIISTSAYLKTTQTHRVRQLAVDIRLYSGLSVYSYAGSNVSKMDKTKTLPDDRPTFNVIQACTDTLVSRLAQNEPAPKFLTDNSDYKQRHLAQELNQFILGEFYQTKAYEKAAKALRDGIVMGTGALKVYEGEDERVAIDRVMITDLYTDDNDALNGEPQTLFQLKLMDRNKLLARTTGAEAVSAIESAPVAYPDNSSDSGRTIVDQVMVVEAWKLASCSDPKSPGYIPGRHSIVTAGGMVLDEEWHKDKFPFVFFKYSDPFLGYWGQGLATQLFGTQVSINRLMYTITKSIQLVGVPRIFVEQGSKVVKAHLNNEVGTIITYSGTKPMYEVAPCIPRECYEERDRLIEYAFRQCGVSNMQATGQKPSGLDSGEAIRSYDDVNSDRFSETSKKYERMFVDLAYLVTDVARDIAERTGKYETVYPNKDGTKEIDLPKMKFLKDPFVIQCFTESSLPRSPAGRIATVTEQVQAGMLTLKEARRLLKFPDLEQNERLENASEERIFKILDNIVEKGEYTPPDAFMDLAVAEILTVQYINLYLAANLEEDKADMLKTFFKQVHEMNQAANQPPMQPQQPTPLANPTPTPVSHLIPNVNTAA